MTRENQHLIYSLNFLTGKNGNTLELTPAPASDTQQTSSSEDTQARGRVSIAVSVNSVELQVHLSDRLRVRGGALEVLDRKRGIFSFLQTLTRPCLLRVKTLPWFGRRRCGCVQARGLWGIYFPRFVVL